MSLNTPPPAPQPAYKKSGLYVFIRSLVKPFWSNLKHRLAVRKYLHHSDRRSFDWQWESIHFNRIALVNLLLSKKINPAYLEIGCASNTLFDSVPVLSKVGVDPASGGTVRATSDRFFESNESRFDVIFIDGLHTYDQVRRDILNSIACLNDGGCIALHDMLPRNWIEHHVPVLTLPSDPWTGDVWKVAFELARTEGIDFRILRIDRGIGVLRALRPHVTLMDLSGELRDKEFSYFYENIGKLPIFEWEDSQTWLATTNDIELAPRQRQGY